MLDVSYHCRWPVAGVNVILLNAGVASDGKESACRSVVANGRDAVGRWHGFVRDSLSAYIPGACLATMANVSMMESGR
jgi:hypothetical protein